MKKSAHPFEPSGEELPPPTSFHFTMDRRNFLKFTGGGLVVAFVLYDTLTPMQQQIMLKKRIFHPARLMPGCISEVMAM